jgi:GT2 family glycosyltransferase
MAPATAEIVAPLPSSGAAPPYLSVVVPVHDGAAELRRCLAALARSSWRDFELVVVDDASTDGSVEVALEHGARVVRQPERRGPAAARNRGARQARGEVLFFLDADCEPAPDALERAARELEREPGLDALFGSYDDRPEASGLVSQFKNLFHHWMHQRSAGPAATFWAGCGAVRRRRFLELGGFDERRYPRPSVEDIELGYRLGEAGGVIRLVPEVQARHLKRWTLASLVATDVRRRALPWAELLLERSGRAGALNVGRRERFAVAAGALACAALPAALVTPWALAVGAAALVALVVSSRSFYALVRRRCGRLYALGALPLHALYGACCSGAFAIAAARHALALGRPRAA